MAGKSKTIERDLGWKRIERELKIAQGLGVRIGIQADETAVGRNQTPVIEYAYYNEFGSEDGKRPPERSFIRSTTDEQRAKWNRMKVALWDKIVSGDMNVRLALSLLGQQAQKDIQQKITTLDTPPNAPRTIAEKGSSNPLIDTGAMRASIRYVVEK